MWQIQWTVVFVALPLIASPDPIVRTKSGSVRGQTVHVPIGNDVDAFLGIPFAEPPIGELRFRKPLAIKSWEDVYDATVLPPPCYQNFTEKFFWTPNVENMSEDCLYLNIWAPNANLIPTKRKPVLIWIHGGGFYSGSSEIDIYDGSILAGYGDVIVASFNYRLGVFGFLTARLEDAPGNMGMYDQVLALKWLKENVEYFGGDPEMITLTGESAGAFSVGLHLVSPITKGLFTRAILQSGGLPHPRNREIVSTIFDRSEEIARSSGCSNDTINLMSRPHAVVECMKQVSPIVLSQSEGVILKKQGLSTLPVFGDEFLPKNSLELLRKGLMQNTDVLIGSNTDEGAIILTVLLPEYFGVYGHKFNTKLPKPLANFIIKNVFKRTEQTNVEEIRSNYISHLKNGYRMPNVHFEDDVIKNLYQSIGDYLFLCSTVFFADYLSLGKNPVYFYMFSHRSTVASTAEWMGATHFAEVPYVFGVPLRRESKYSEDEKILSKRIMDRWLSFAKTGNPNIPGALEWPRYKWNNPAYLEINLREKIEAKPDEYRCEFWRDRFNANLSATLHTSLASSTSANISMILCLFLILHTRVIRNAWQRL